MRGIIRAGHRFEGGLLFNSGALLCRREENPVGTEILKIQQRGRVIHVA